MRCDKLYIYLCTYIRIYYIILYYIIIILYYIILYYIILYYYYYVILLLYYIIYYILYYICVHTLKYRCVSERESWLTCHEIVSRDKLLDMAADWLWDMKSPEIPRTPNSTANRYARRSRVLKCVPKYTKNKYLKCNNK